MPSRPDRNLGTWSLQATDDHALVERVRAGDAEAFAAVFTRYADTLCRSVCAYVGSPAVAEELVQDLFLKVWRNRAAWHVPGGLDAYLYLAARNQAIDWLRRDRRARRWQAGHQLELSTSVATPAMADSVADIAHGEPPSDIGEALERAERDAAIVRAVAELPAAQRAVCELRWRDGLSYAAIAVRLGVTEKTVGNHLTRAVKRVRERVRELVP